MKIVIFLLAALLVEPAIAQPPVKVEISVNAADLNLSREADVKRLENRITFRIRLHCGRVNTYFSNPMRGNGAEDYAACIGQFVVADTRPEVQAALAGAVKRVALK